MADGPRFTDPAHHDDTLGSSSPARNYGLVRPPATEGSGVATHAAGAGSVLGSFDGGDWVRYDDVDFGTGRNLLVASIGSEQPYAGGGFEVRLDSDAGPVVGTVRVENTGGWDTYLDQTFAITPTSGTHDVYLKALGTAPGVANIDHFSVERMISQLGLTAPLAFGHRPRPPRTPGCGCRGG
ncbi:carbohydrate-binding protein [Streptomyces sp. NPDC060275]|uniref:carbohydrate-binding protein n=1 Tax=Streptomyces sp. NPDC060275 TaxID=3347090 RepID=UPI0036540211